MTTWVKICGVTRADDARAAFDAGADAIGINFWPGSRRYCDPERARMIVEQLPMGALVYGVFVDQPRHKIEAVVRAVGLSGVQLHGSEPVEDAEGWEVPVIRAIRATSRELVERELGPRLSALQHDAGAAPTIRLLVDSAAGGGSGIPVDDGLLDGLDLSSIILAGGLTPTNVAASVARLHPFGVDTAGGVESAPGIKDPDAVARFVREARGSD